MGRKQDGNKSNARVHPDTGTHSTISTSAAGCTASTSTTGILVISLEKHINLRTECIQQLQVVREG